MTAETVYTVAKALPEMEYMRLVELLNQDNDSQQKYSKLKVNRPILSNREAIDYLLKNVFSSDSVSRNIRNSRKAANITNITNI